MGLASFPWLSIEVLTPGARAIVPGKLPEVILRAIIGDY